MLITLSFILPVVYLLHNYLGASSSSNLLEQNLGQDLDIKINKDTVPEQELLWTDTAPWLINITNSDEEGTITCPLQMVPHIQYACEDFDQHRKAMKCYNCNSKSDCLKVEGADCGWIELHDLVGGQRCRYFDMTVFYVAAGCGIFIIAMVMVTRYRLHEQQILDSERDFDYWARKIRWFAYRVDIKPQKFENFPEDYDDDRNPFPVSFWTLWTKKGFRENFWLHLKSELTTLKILFLVDEAHFTSAYEAWVMLLLSLSYAAFMSMSYQLNWEDGNPGFSATFIFLTVTLPNTLIGKVLNKISSLDDSVEITRGACCCCSERCYLCCIRSFTSVVYGFFCILALIFYGLFAIGLPYALNPKCLASVLFPLGWIYAEVISMGIIAAYFIVQWMIEIEGRRDSFFWRNLALIMFAESYDNEELKLNKYIRNLLKNTQKQEDDLDLQLKAWKLPSFESLTSKVEDDEPNELTPLMISRN